MKNQAISSPRSTFQFDVARLPASKLQLASCLLFLLCAFGHAAAQSQRTEGERTFAPSAVAAATSRGARFVAQNSVVEMRLEVFSSTGEKMFDSAFRRGSVIDWDATGAQQTGVSGVPDDSYLCVLTLRDLSGSLRQRHSLVAVQSGNVVLRRAGSDQLSVAQAQAWAASRETQALAAQSPDGDAAALDIVSEQEARAMIVAVHDGQDGQVTSTAGALTFRTGDLFTGGEKEQMRVTPEGQVGIGTDKPEATLDVAGTIRAAKGFEFANGTTLSLTDGKLTLRDAAGDPVSSPNAAGTGTVNRLAKWQETGGAGTLTDAAAAESGGLTIFGQNSSGQVAPLFPTAANNHIVEVGATGSKSPLVLAGGSGLMEFWKDLGGGTGAPAAAVAFGMARPGLAATNDMVFSTYTPAASWNERMRITTAGNVGVGASAPSEKLEVAGNFKLTGTNNGVIFPDGTKQTTASTGGVTGTGTTNTVPLWTGTTALGNSVITQSGGNVGIGVAVPLQKLDVAGNVNTSTQYRLGGLHALSNTGVNNLFAGASAGAVNTGSANSFFGALAGDANTDGHDNSFFGSGAGGLTTTSDFNSFFGSNAGAANVTGLSNSFFGASAGAANTATGNSFFGTSAGASTTSGTANAFFGKDAGLGNITGTGNSFFGHSAGAANTAHGNSFFGRNAGALNTSGGGNAFFGDNAGAANTNEGNNSYFGDSAGSGSTGTFNSFFGGNAGSNNDGISNSFFGWRAGWINVAGSGNTFIGESAGSANTSGGSNLFVGHDAGLSNTTEANNTFIGASSNGAAGITNSTALGASAVVTQSDSLVLGNGVKVGAGTSAPKEKLHVLGGNILIDGAATNNNGLILKSPDGLVCAKLTIDNAGTLVTTVITCP